MLTTREKFIILVDNDRLKKSDCIVILEGDGLNRIRKAAELYKAKYSSQILFSGGLLDKKKGAYSKEYVVPELIKFGIKSKDIIIEDNSLNTREQAINVIDLSIKFNWKRLILVASHYHQYRAYLTFIKRVFELGLSIEIINAPARELGWFEQTEWGVRFNLLEEEFKKIELYQTLGHLASFEEAIEYQKWKEEQI